MTLDDVRKFYGTSYRFEKMTKMSSGCWPNWRRIGYIPMVSQKRLEELTGGILTHNYAHLAPNKEG